MIFFLSEIIQETQQKTIKILRKMRWIKSNPANIPQMKCYTQILLYLKGTKNKFKISQQPGMISKDIALKIDSALNFESNESIFNFLYLSKAYLLTIYQLFALMKRQL